MFRLSPQTTDYAGKNLFGFAKSNFWYYLCSAISKQLIRYDYGNSSKNISNGTYAGAYIVF